MIKLEDKILEQFKKKMKDEVKDLELFVALSDDCWPDCEGIYQCEVMENQDNGKVWTCVCTKSGNIKDIYEVG